MILSSFFLFNACNKDVLVDNNSSGLVSYNWSPKEKDFFNFSNKSTIIQKANSIAPRNSSSNMPVLLTAAYNQIALQNENENFVEGLTHTIGIPFWSYSFVYQNAEKNEGIVIIPFGHENGMQVEALLVGTKSLQYPDQKMYFKFVLRRDIERVINTDSIKSRPNFNVEIANFIIDEMAIFNYSNEKFLNFILNNSTNIESKTADNGNLSLRNDDCIYYEIEFCTYLGDYITGGGNLGDWNNFGPDPNGGWTSPGGGNVFGDSSSDDGNDDQNNGGYDDPRNSGGGGFGKWWKGVKSNFWEWYRYIMIHCAFLEVNPNNKNNQQVGFSNDQQLKLRDDSDWACIVYFEKWCYGNDGWYEEALNMADECAQALANFEYHYGLDLSEEEKEYLTAKMGTGWCDDYGGYYEQAISWYLMYHLNLTDAEEMWLDLHPDERLKLFGYQLNNTYPDEALNYFIWAMMNHGHDLNFYTTGYDTFGKEDNTIFYPPPSKIKILHSYVPNFAPTNIKKFAETDWYNNAHKYDPLNNIIPEDLQHGTNGNTNLLSRYTPANRELLNLNNHDLLMQFNNLIHKFELNSDLQNVATEYYDRFVSGQGGDYFNEELCNYILTNGHTIATVQDFGKELNRILKKINGDFSKLNYLGLPATFRAQYSKGERQSGLQILINDTEKLYIYDMGDYTFDNVTKEWSVSFYFQIFDNFGLDNEDLLDSQGIYVFDIGKKFAAWWILQHVRDYIPFRTEIRSVFKIKGDLDDVTE